MSDMGRLFVCATPIGNLGDVSVRLAEVLENVDVIYAEDTRRVAKLLSHLGLKVKTRALFAGNESERTAELVRDLEQGVDVALVSDAGMPVVSDPGALAVDRARSLGATVTVIPGPSAVTMALALSGFPGDRFAFEGFLPRKGQDRVKRLADIAADPRAVVLFASPHRLLDDLRDLSGVVGPERPITINRELTKIHEEVWAGPIGDSVATWEEKTTKGEFTLVLGPLSDVAPDVDTAIDAAKRLVGAGLSVSEAARLASGETGASRRQIYEALLADQALS
jgi:16S rRNA (cytidine1402-2'-O)-methyltransferase